MQWRSEGFASSMGLQLMLFQVKTPTKPSKEEVDKYEAPAHAVAARGFSATPKEKISLIMCGALI